MPNVSEVKAISDKLHTDFEEFKRTHQVQLDEIKKNGVSQAILEEKIQRINAALDAAEKKFTDGLKDLEAKTKTPPISAAEEKANKLAEKKAIFEKFIRKGKAELTPEEVKVMTVADNTTGGIFATEDVDTEIIKAVTEYSPIRELALVRPTTGQARKIRKRTSAAGAAVWVAESGTRAATGDPAYVQDSVPNHEIYALVDVSTADLEDSSVNLEAELNSEFAEQFALAEGTAFYSGIGVGKPFGFSINPTVVASYKTTCADTTNHLMASDDLISCLYALKDSYAKNSTWLFLRAQIGKIRKLKDPTIGSYIWSPGLATLAPPTILDRPYRECPDMLVDGTGAGRVIGALADWKQFYVIVDRRGTELVRDDLTQRTAGNIRFLATRRVGGQVRQPEAGRIIVTG